jgi:hypothetical protein
MPRGRPKKVTDAIAEVVSVKHVDPDNREALLKQIEELQAQLADQTEKLTEAQKAALAVAETQGALFHNVIEEVPTGRTRTVQKLEKYKRVGFENGRPVLEPVFMEQEVPTWFYKIDLPPSGGEHIRINGAEFYHGSVGEFDMDTLRTVKDLVFRNWRHEESIMGSNENAYRKPLRPVLSGGGR